MKQLSGKSLNKIFIPKIDLPALLAFALFAGLIFFYLIPVFESVMMDRKRHLIHELTSSAYSLLEYYHSRENSGELDREEAKERAMAAIGTIRYGDEQKDYFWITDMFPRMIAHPYRPELNGKDLTNYRDSKGKTIFVEFVKAVSRSGESYVEYMWQWNDDSTRIVPKLSYVRKFEPWSWIIGTGIYIEDVRSEIRRMETRALLISGIIGIIIIALLAAISRQSHKIEQKRTKAEEELSKSRELYRTLAEAASEGVMIWSGRSIQANKTVLSWLEYPEEELRDLLPGDILISPETADFADPDSVYEELSAQRNMEVVLRKKNGKLIKSLASFSRILLGGMKAVLIVVRPSEGVVSQPGFLLQPSLLKDVTTGFFRITFGRKNVFISASEPVLKVLGYASIQDLAPHTVESLFIDPGQFRSFRATLESGKNIFNREVLLRHKNGDELRALVSVIIVKADTGDIWCEGSIEPLTAGLSRNNSPMADLNEYSASYIMQAPVSSISVPAVECRESMTALRAAAVMKENNTSIAVVTGKEGKPLGIIDSEIIGFRLAEGASPDNEIFRWMSSPPGFIRPDASIGDAFGMIGNSLRNCLLVSPGDDKVTGLITYKVLTEAFSKAPRLIIREIENAVASHTLRDIWIKNQKTAIAMILGRAHPYSVSLFLSGIADTICRRAIALCLEEAGEPPCRFAFIQTGSAGRREQTFSTDQDNAIIFENQTGDALKKAETYFTGLGKKVNKMLGEAGFRLCKGDNMAGNPKWCQPADKWKKYFSDWIKMPGPDELLEISIFFDFRFCYGDQHLSDELRKYIKNDLTTNDIFFHHMTAAWKHFEPSQNMLSGGKTDIKRLIMPLTGIIRLYALKHGTAGLSTLERIIDLHSGGHLSHELLSGSMSAWKDLTTIRLNHQVNCINEGKEPDNIVDFNVSDADMLYFAEKAVATLNDLMLKAGSDFHTETI